MSSWLRQHRYALRVAMVRLATRPFSSLANIFVLAIALAVPFIGWALLLSTQPLVQHIPVSTELTVFLQAQVEEVDRAALEEQFQEQFAPWVKGYHFIPKEEALAQLKNNPSWDQALSVLDDNPLPDAYVLEISQQEQPQEAILEVAQALGRLPAVEQVLLDIDWLQKLDTLLGLTEQALFLLSLGVLLIVVGTVFNTIRLQSLNHQEEIAVARMVGATESFVRRPFLYFGALTGLFASLLALLIGTLTLNSFSDTFARIAASYHINLQLHLPDVLSIILAFLLVVIIAALAARWSVGRRASYQL